MRIGIVGTGNLGRTLGLSWTSLGHEVMFGARDPRQAELAASFAVGRAHTGTNLGAAQFGDLVVWGVRDVPVAEVIGDPATLAGKLVVDPHNGPLLGDFALHPAPGLPSHAERLAAQLPGARVVKAFNTLAQEVYELPPSVLRDHAVTVFLAGDDEEAKGVVAALAEAAGFATTDAGPLPAARMLEGLGDFVRHLIVGGAGVYATLGWRAVPAAAVPRFGGRTPSRLP